jgi:protein-disulfide isomerase
MQKAMIRNALLRFASSALFFVLVFSIGLVRAPAAESGDCVRGKATAPIKIEVFSDFQCPACRAFYLETIKQVMTEYGDTGKACIAYREFPLSMHAHAKQAARYGHAALKISPQLWLQVADALFQNQDTWAASGDIESTLAKALSPKDLAAIKKLVAGPAPLDAAIEADIKLGTQKEINSTPTFFVTAAGKTEKVPGAIRFPILKRYLDSRPTN